MTEYAYCNLCPISSACPVFQNDSIYLVTEIEGEEKGGGEDVVEIHKCPLANLIKIELPF